MHTAMDKTGMDKTGAVPESHMGGGEQGSFSMKQAPLPGR